LPSANVTFVSGGSGPILSTGTIQLVLGVSPAGLASGGYGGQITVSNAPGTPYFAPFTVNVFVTVGNNLVVGQPAGGTLTLSLPVGYPNLSVPSSVLASAAPVFSSLEIIDGQIAGSPAINVNGPVAAPGQTPGIVVAGTGTSPITTGTNGILNIAYQGGALGACYTAANGTVGIGSGGGFCAIPLTFNTVGLTPGTTYTGTVTVTGTIGVAPTQQTFTAQVPVNLTITGTPAIVALTQFNAFAPAGSTAAPITPTNGVVLTWTAGQPGPGNGANGGGAGQVCTGPGAAATASQGQVQTNPFFATTAGDLGTGIFTVVSTSNFITSPAPGGAIALNVNGGMPQAFCVNPLLLGNAPGAYFGTVTVTAAGANNSPFTVPVTLLLNNLPGHIQLSNIGVFRNVNGSGVFYENTNTTTYNYAASTTLINSFGLPGDQPVTGDWLGTGMVSIGVFRSGAWYLDLNNDGIFESNEGPFFYGLPGDKAVVGDWTGSGTTKIGVFRPTGGGATWYLNPTQLTAAMLVPFANLYNAGTTIVYNFGLATDTPVVNNWNGASNGVDMIGVFRCSSAAGAVCQWIVDTVGNGIVTASEITNAYSFGLLGDAPVVGNWNGNGRKRIGVFRNGLWILDVNGSNTYAPNDIFGSFGLATGDTPVVGLWTN